MHQTDRVLHQAEEASVDILSRLDAPCTFRPCTSGRSIFVAATGRAPLFTGAVFPYGSPLLKSIWARAQFVWQSTDLRSHILICLVGVAIGLVCLISPWIALVSVLGVIFFVAALSKPIILCYWMVVTIALMPGMERGRLIPLLMPNEVSLLLSVSIASLITLVGKRRQIGFSGYYSMAFIALVGGCVFIPIAAYLEQGVELTFNSAFKLVAPIQYFLLFWLFATLPQSEKDRHRLIGWMLVCGSVVAVVGLMQALGVGFVTRLLDTWYASDHEAMAVRAGRVTSLLGAWNSLGIFMMFNFLIGLAILPEVDKPIGRASTITVMALSAICLVASGSYAGILGLITGVLLIEALAQRRMRLVPIIVLCSAGVVIAILFLQPFLQPLVEKRLAYQYRYGGLVPQTLLFRFEVWREIFIPAIQQHFPWAVYPTVPSSYAWQYEESQYILLLFRLGLAGFLGFLAWIGITISWLYRIHRQSSGFTNALVTSALTLIIVLSIAGLTNEVFSFAGSADYLWIMLALIANSREKLA